MRCKLAKPALLQGLPPSATAPVLQVVFLFAIAAAAQNPAAKAVGTVKSVSGNSVVLTTDSGSETTVTFADSARIVRATPGQTDLKSATPIQVSDIQVGDRVAARGQAGEGNSLSAVSAIVMKQGDIAQRQQAERDEWRKGVGGLVKSVDMGTGTITLTNSLAASGKAILVHVSTETSVHRYAPDSIKFDDAKPGTLDQIRPGDQLRARGTKNADGTEITAQGVVSGSFRDVAGTVISTNVTNQALTVMDLTTKKPITVKISADSQLRKLPPFAAQMIAMRLKGGAPAGAGAGGGGAATGQSRAAQGARNSNAGGQGGQGNWRGEGGPGATGSGMQAATVGSGRAGSGTADFQQMLSRMPAVTISDLNKGDAVMLVATQGSSQSGPTAITLLAGVDAILSAAPAGAGAFTMLSPWNLGTGAGAGGDPSTQ